MTGFDVTVHRGEVRAHRHDQCGSPGIASCGDIAGPLVVPARVLLDGLEGERFAIPPQFDKPGFDPSTLI